MFTGYRSCSHWIRRKLIVAAFLAGAAALLSAMLVPAAQVGAASQKASRNHRPLPSPIPQSQTTPISLVTPTATPVTPTATGVIFTATPVVTQTTAPSPTSGPPTGTPAATQTAIPSPTSVPPTTTPGSASGYQFGTLLSDPSHATAEYAAGVRVVELELGWDAYEPQDGVFSASYAAAAKAKLQAFQQAGMQVVLGLGLQYPPGWVFGYPNSRFVDQYGASAGEPNLVFNQTLRQKAEAYIQRVAQDLGGGSFWAVRIGSGGDIEALYPDESDGAHGNAYWAYDAAAQTGVGLPASIPTNPYPGWKPGQTSYNGQVVTAAQVGQWYSWYVGGLVDVIGWQIATYKKNGYTGYMQVVLPGLGSRPDEQQAAISSHLNGTGDPNGTMGRGAAWDRVIGGIGDRQKLVIYVSSMADGSGGNDLCQGADSGVSATSSVVDSWSATRWISYNANRFGLLKMGENPGKADTSTYGLTLIGAAARQMQACGFQGLMLAHDSNLFDGVSGISLAGYGSLISQYP